MSTNVCSVNVCDAYRGMIKETVQVPEDKYQVDYTYDVLNPQTQKTETKTGSVSILVPVGVTVKMGTPRKI
jgi:hypothetical protein